MSTADSSDLLERIEESIVEHGGDLGGWTKRTDETLQIFDGRVSLRIRFHDAGPSATDDMVHAHVLATLHDHDDEELDACVFGMGKDRDAALAQAAMLWMMCVAGPIKSFIDGVPVCMTCQAGVQGGDLEEGYSPGDYGLPNLRAFVGPSVGRGFEDDSSQPTFDDDAPWFRYAAESAAPRRVHLAKSIVFYEGEKGWRRELEIDGHDVSHQDPDWAGPNCGHTFGYFTRFAVFEFPRNSAEIRRRAKLEKTIHHFAVNMPLCESVDQLQAEMVRDGFDPDLVQEAESFATIAFGRLMFEPHGMQYPSTVIRARRDGSVETDVPLMSVSAYSRGRAIGAKLRETMSEEDFQSLALYNAESQGIMQALESMGDDFEFSDLSLYPCVVPDRDVSDDTMSRALAILNRMVEGNRQAPPAKRKPWWKFW